jgi:hypothetical protein
MVSIGSDGITEKELALAWQHIELEPYRLAEPKGVDGVIAVGIAGFRVNEDAQALAIEHEKRHKAWKLPGRKGDLVHRDRMRTDRLVMPASKDGRESLADLLSQPFRYGSAPDIIIDMGMIARDPGGIVWCHRTTIDCQRTSKKSCA